MNGWIKCGLPTYWNTTHPIKRMKSCHFDTMDRLKRYYIK